MKKLSRKKWLWLLVPPIAVVIFLQLRFGLLDLVATLIKVQMMSCSEPIFTEPPVDFENLTYIVPLGNLNPPDHTIPTDHIYINLPASAGEGIRPAVKIANVYAPGDLVITSIDRVEYFGADGNLQRQDFSMNFAACKAVRGYYHHLSALSPELTEMIQNKSGNCEQYNIDSAGAKSVRRCGFYLGHSVTAGSKVGEAGELYSSFDLGLTDDRTVPLAFANPERYYSEYTKTVCPIDYYQGETKQKLMASFGGFGGKKRTQPPVCGEIMQDKLGSAQGNWFIGDAKDGPEGWTKELALVHDNGDPSLGVISAGGLNGQAFRLQFNPVNNGFKNREFSEIKPGKDIYCYPNNGMGYGIKAGQEVLLELIDDTHLKIELKTGSCEQPYAFSNPIIYER